MKRKVTIKNLKSSFTRQKKKAFSISIPHNVEYISHHFGP